MPAPRRPLWTPRASTTQPHVLAPVHRGRDLAGHAGRGHPQRVRPQPEPHRTVSGAPAARRRPARVCTTPPAATPSQRTTSRRGTAPRRRPPGCATPRRTAPSWRISPASSTATRSASVNASSWSCVTSSAVILLRRNRSARSMASCSRSPASKPDSGSSSSSSRGSGASARASATRCAWPPDSSVTRRRSKPAEADQLQQLVDPRRRSRPRHAVHPQAERDVRGDVAVGEQLAVLEHQAEPAPVHRHRAEVVAVPAHRAARRRLEAR